MPELPTQFMSADPRNTESASEKVLNPELAQAWLRLRTINRFRALHKAIDRMAVSAYEEILAAEDKLDDLGKREYGKAWEVVKNPNIEIIPIVVGGKTGTELAQELRAKQIDILTSINLLEHADFERRRRKTAEPQLLAKISMPQLGYKTRYATTQEVFARAAELGLALCSPDAAPQFRLMSNDDEEWLSVGMYPIAEDDGLSVFWVGSQQPMNSNIKKWELSLGVMSAEFEKTWKPDNTWIFTLPASQ